ncbi:hypothetical protein E3U47_12850 [Pseudomonas sp. RIT623]|nr:hypothetical protein E3U47_12850 [Pseudomonas sp. RIT623]
MRVRLEIAGAALQPFRDTRPLLQGRAVACGSALVSRKGREAAPALAAINQIHQPGTQANVQTRPAGIGKSLANGSRPWRTGAACAHPASHPPVDP